MSRLVMTLRRNKKVERDTAPATIWLCLGWKYRREIAARNLITKGGAFYGVEVTFFPYPLENN